MRNKAKSEKTHEQKLRALFLANSRRGWSVAAVVFISTLILSFGLLKFRLSLIADDFYISWLLHKNGFIWPWDLYMFARMPLSSSLQAWLARTAENYPRLFILFFFTLHSAAIALFLRLLVRFVSRKVQPIPFIVAGVLFSLVPQQFEILLWPLLSVHLLASLLIAIAFHMQSRHWMLLFSVLGLMSYDTFIFELIGFSVLFASMNHSSSSVFDLSPRVTPRRRVLFTNLVLAVMVWLLSKVVLGKMVGYLQIIPLEKSFGNIFSHLSVLMKMLWGIHFYKTNWVLTLVQDLAILSMGISLIRRRVLALREFVFLMLLASVVALPLCLNVYPAPRAYFGPLVVQSLVFAFLVYLFLISCAKNRSLFRQIWPVILIAMAYGIQGTHILQTKDKNVQTLENNEAALLELMRTCESPCRLVVPSPAQGLTRDYVLPAFIWPFYWDRLRWIHFPEKQVDFQVGE